MKVAIYCRVSTDHQSVDSQLNELHQYAKQRGLEIYKEYIDIASGAKTNRPNLNMMMNDARKKLFSCVAVFKFDRAARSSTQLVNMLTELQNLGIDFLSLKENVDTSTPIGKAMFTIISAFAELEKDVIRERVRAGINTARMKGRKLGRPQVRDDKAINELRAKGYSIRKIADKLSISIGSVQRGLFNNQLKNFDTSNGTPTSS